MFPALIKSIISHVPIMMKSVEFTALFLWGNRGIFLYNKKNNAWMLGNMKSISRVKQDISLIYVVHS